MIEHIYKCAFVVSLYKYITFEWNVYFTFSRIYPSTVSSLLPRRQIGW